MKTGILLSILVITLFMMSPPCQGDNPELHLSPEEVAWIGRHPAVRVRIGSAPPFMMTDGNIRGIAIDYLTHIFNLHGIEIRYIGESEVTWPAALDGIRRHQVVDMVPTAKITEERKKHMIFTQEYIFAPWVIFTRAEAGFISSIKDLAGKTVAVEEGFVIHEKLKNEYPGIKLNVISARLDNYAELPVKYLSTGVVDAYIGNLLMTTYLIQTKGYTNIKVAAPTPFDNHNQAMAIRDDWPELAAIINKTLASMSPDEHAAIRNRWLSIRYEYGISTADVLKWVFGVLGIASLFVGVVLFWNRRLKNEVTYRKTIEETLLDREKLLNDVGKIAKIGGWEMDLATRKAKWTKGIYDIVGIEPGHPIPGPDEHLQYYLPEDRPLVEKAMTALIKEGRHLEFEARFMAIDGTIKWCRAVGRPLYKDGTCVRIFGTLQDITERRKTEDALKENELRYKKAQRLGRVGNWEYDLVTEQFWGSDEARRIYGFDLDSDRFTTEEVEKCIPDRDRVHQALVDLVEKNTPYNLEFEIHPASGDTRRFIRSIAERIADDSGNPIKIVGVIQDITQQKETEKEKQRLELQLIQAHKMEAIGTLAGGVAHEFNNLLGIILGNAELAADDVPEWNLAYDYLTEIRNASLRGKDVVKQLLSFSRNNTLTKEPVDLADIVSEAVRFLRASIPANIQFAKEIPLVCHPVMANPTQMHQLMINLCTNAAHAMEDNGGTLGIRLESVQVNGRLFAAGQRLDPGEYLRLSISDTGQGIPDTIIDHVFDPFFTTKEIDKGSGLGLAVVYGIIKDHNAFIDITSNRENGTTVSCYFPLSDAAPASTAGTGEEPGQQESETILIVDDEPSLAKMLRRQLERQGYSVESETDPSTALERFRQAPEKFDLVITDMTMPQMTGAQLIRELKQIRKDIRTIICTGYDKQVASEKTAEIGVNGFIMKPINRGTLLKTVREVLDESKESTRIFTYE